jgi:hypothetical protein
MRDTRARTYAITCRETSGDLLSQGLMALGFVSTCTHKQEEKARERGGGKKGESEEETGPDLTY